jgi:NAD(P)-dependent dehydrogenase (short-subunit alcohol dehydrogenase family)
LSRLAGKTAVITGAAGGLGLGLAERLAARGASVVIADIDAAQLKEAEAHLASRGVDVLAVPTDVTKEDQVARLARAATARFGAVHVVCLNAGVSMGGTAWELSDADFRWAFDVNFFGVVHGVRAFVPLLLAQGEGHVLITASNSAVATVKGIAPYVASKHAVLALAETLFQDLRAVGAPVRLAVALPAGIRSRIAESFRHRQSEYGPADVPAERLAASQSFLDEHGSDPDEVAERIVVPFLEGEKFYLFTDDRDLTMLDARVAGIHTGRVAPPATPGVYKPDPTPEGTKSRPRMRRTGS